MIYEQLHPKIAAPSLDYAVSFNGSHIDGQGQSLIVYESSYNPNNFRAIKIWQQQM